MNMCHGHLSKSRGRSEDYLAREQCVEAESEPGNRETSSSGSNCLQHVKSQQPHIFKLIFRIQIMAHIH